jgi:hypothetical protein
MDNIQKVTGTTEPFKLNAGGGISYPFAVRGIVKETVDSVKTGRIRVYIDDFGATDPNNANNWRTVCYMSPFYGTVQNTNIAPNKSDYGTFTQNPHSYGFWATAPDVGTEVMCLFLYGKEDFGYYIGCLPQPGLNHMVPAVGSSSNVIMNSTEAENYGGATALPTVEVNNNLPEFNTSTKFNELTRPVHRFVATQMFQQGVIRDKVRGPITSSASRESPSHVFGFSTPGRPIYSGASGENSAAQGTDLLNSTHDKAKIIARQGGHSLVMDDGDNFGESNLIRLRTSAGHQITMSDDGQTLFVTHANGQSYVELGKEGTVDIYSTNSFNVRTKGDINFHADNNINLFAAKQMNIRAEEININSDKNTNLRVGDQFNQQTLGTHLVKVNKAMSFDAKDQASFKSDQTTYINGSKVNLNTGASGSVPKEIKPIVIITHPDTLFDSSKGWIPAPGKLVSITSRAPAHQPWLNSNKGVDVKIDETADSAFPSAPSPAVAATNNNNVTQPTAFTTPTLAGTISPAASAVNKNFDQNVTNTLVSQQAVNVASNPQTATAVQQGGGIITNVNGTKAAVMGKLGHSPAQLEAGGYLKPGSSVLIDSLIAQGKTLANAMPTNLWTGKDGVTKVTDFQNNTTAQSGTQVELMKQGIFGLKEAGVINGNESPAQIGGLIQGVAAFGVGPITAYVRNNGVVNTNVVSSFTAVVSTSQNAINQFGASLKSTVASGNYASNLAEKVASPIGSMLSSVSNTVSGIADSVKGAAAGVFNSIKASYAKLTADKPQNLTTLNAASSATGSNPVGALAGGVNAVTNVVAPITQSSILASVSSLGQQLKTFIANNTSSGGNNPALTSLASSVVGGLQKTALGGLAAGALSTMSSALKSISSGGSQLLKMPTVATGTNNRSSVESNTKAALGDTRIPQPPTTETTAKAPVEQLQAALEEVKREIEESKRQNDLLQQKSLDAKMIYGANSDEFNSAYEEWKAEFKRRSDLRSKEVKLLDEILNARFA